jgi:sulfate adenylyltransferase
MISPYASGPLDSRFVEDPVERAALVKDAETLPSTIVNSAAAANLVMLGAGYFNPLRGTMNLADSLEVAEKLHTTSGLFWPVPIVHRTKDVSTFDGAPRVALRDPNRPGNPVLAVQEVAGIDEAARDEILAMTEQVFGTLDATHPGVATFLELGAYFISGPVQVLNLSYFEEEFPETFRTAGQIRAEIEQRGWQKVVAFQTRNPMHRAHEELCKMALEAVGADGVLVHMLLGKLKPGDIPAPIRDAAIRKMVDLYFPENSVMVTGYGFDMLYAGPREAVLHAIFRQNCGCTHLIVGRDHAGVGDFYGPFDAQQVFQTSVPSDALEIEIFPADHTAFSKKLGRVVMMKDAPDHQPEDFVILSGTKVRELLAAGQGLPPEFARPEVAEILMGHYRDAAGGQ